MGPLILVVLDGWGISNEKRGNAILSAKTPNYNELLTNFPNTQLSASGLDVGLPPGLMGNSEVGHLTIGAGRVIKQKLTIISEKIADGSFFKNPVLLEAIAAASSSKGALHIFGLLSNGCVHSSLDHLDGLLELARLHKIPEVIIHPILDGRDTPPRSASKFLQTLVNQLHNNEKIGVVSGRYYAMDRDKRWERTEKYWRALVLQEGVQENSPVEAIEKFYAKDVTDEFIEPFIVTKRGIKDGDAIICFNFRPDRVRQITQALTQAQFAGFKRDLLPKVYYTCLTEYDSSLNLPIAFDAQTMHTPDIIETLPDILSCKQMRQYHTAETEKYAHVTYFFNGGREAPEVGEDRQMVPSLKVATYDRAPAMQTAQVCELACQAAKSLKYPFIVLNFANPDMVGHTGMLEPAIEAVQSVDRAFACLIDTVREVRGTLVVTADHGNCEQMIDFSTGEPHTAHTTNPVPFILADFQTNGAVLGKEIKLNKGSLADIAPTILQILKIDQPKAMSGHSLLK